jgi:DNA-binding response OmpR family regulator
LALVQATKLHQDELEKTKTELQAKINTAKTALKDANSKARKGEDLERVLPSLLGISVGCQYRKSDDQTVRILLVTTKSSLSDKPETLFLKATIPAGDPTASIRLTLQENSSLKAGAMAENVAKHITSTAGTSAEHAGVPALFASVTMQEFERLVALATAEGGAGGVTTAAVESTAGSSSTVKDEPV